MFNATPIPRLVQLYDDGVLTRNETVLRLLVSLGTVPVADHFHEIPAALRELVSEDVRDAPTTESAWGDVMIISSYCGPEKTPEEFAAEKQAGIMQYRTGVEAVRAFLDAKP